MASQYPQENLPANQATDSLPDPEHVKRGLRGAITNPNNSEEAKDRARGVLNEVFGDNYQPPTKEDKAREQAEKDPKHVAAGLLGAVHNERVSDEAKERASETLVKSGQVKPEDIAKLPL